MSAARAALLLCLICLSFPTNSHAEATKTVVVEGIGATIDEAFQNAAEQALMLVVGQYVDAETMISERAEIKNGIRDEANSISRTVREVSNGTIKRVEALGLPKKTNSGIFRVEAAVTVRIDNVRVLIKPFSSATAAVSKGLFAGITKDKAQEKDQKSIITDRIIFPILTGRFVEANIIGLESFSNHRSKELMPTWLRDLSDYPYRRYGWHLPAPWLQAASGPAGYGSKTPAFNHVEWVESNRLSADENYLALGIELKLADNLKRQIKELLDEFALAKQTVDLRDDQKINSLENRFKGKPNHKTVCTLDPPYKLTCYIIDNGRKLTAEPDVNDLFEGDSWLLLKSLFNINVDVLDANAETIVKDVVRYPDTGQMSLDPIARFNSTTPKGWNRIIFPKGGNIGKRWVIQNTSTDLIYMKLSDAELKRAASIKITLTMTRDVAIAYNERATN